MKMTVHRLRIGDILRAQVVETVDANECIVSFNGDLVRVRNESDHALKPDDKILVRVVQVNPLCFQFVGSQDKIRANRMNLTV